MVLVNTYHIHNALKEFTVYTHILPGFLYVTIRYNANTADNVIRAVHQEIRNITTQQRIAPNKLSHLL